MRGANRAGRRALACLALSLLPVASAGAQFAEETPLPSWYLGPMVGYGIPDSSRAAKNGLNFQLVGGRVLAEAVAVELSAFGTKFDSDVSGGPETELTGGGLDLALGTPDYGSPVFLLGAGTVAQKIAGVSENSTYGNLGLGIYLPFTFGGELWRIEGRYQAVFDDDLIEDIRVNLGVLFAFGRKPPEPPPPPPAPVSDADEDGVADASDRCPGTPRWVRPDANGCAPDSDNDGVDETQDDCPSTPPGTTVDDTGCEPRPVATAPQAPFDEDADGIADASDSCPHTVPRFNVDTRGCVIPEDVTMRNVHFDSSSWRLTADGYALLRSVGATLKVQPGITLEVQGHADSSGPLAMNQELSLQRAEVVRDFLTYLGIPASRFTVKAYGEGQSLNDNKTRESRSTNRRVQFRRTDQQ